METTTGATHPASGWLAVGKVVKVLLWLVYAWLIVNLVVLLLAFFLLLFGANPSAGFVEWVYRSASRTMAPFRGMFEPIQLNGESVLDTSILFAMIIYSLAALFLRYAIDWVTAKVTPPPAPQRAMAARPPVAGAAPPPPQHQPQYQQPQPQYQQPQPPPAQPPQPPPAQPPSSSW